MASPHTPNWTVEFSHSGAKRLLRNDAETEVIARREFARVVRSMNDANATIDYSTLKKHETTAAATKYIGEYRKARGLSEQPTPDELAANAQAVLAKPDPEDDEDDS